MNSNAIFQLIEQIAATSSKNDKQALVAANIHDLEVQRALEYAYNPFKRFYMRKRPATIGEHVGNEFDAGTWELLDDIIARKLTGQAAIDAVAGEMTALSKESAELFWRIIKKDLRAGFSESTINKAKKGLIPEFPYMRCCLPKDTKVDQFKWDAGVLSQEKADGMFTNVDHTADGAVAMYTRQGSPLPVEAFEALVVEIQDKTVPGTQMHGELIVIKGGEVCAREIGNGILNHVIDGGAFAEDEHPVYLAWDQIPLDAVKPKGKFERYYAQRVLDLKKQLTGGVNVQLIPTRIVHSLAEAYAHYGELLAKGKEGTVFKNPTAFWKDGTSKDQVKLKLEVDVDLRIKAIMPGKEGTKNEGRAGAFRCATSCDQLVVDVTVKNEKLRDEVDANPDAFIEKILVVRANDIMKPSESSNVYSLFLPRMAETSYRRDKSVADSLVRVQDQFEAAKKGAA